MQFLFSARICICKVANPEDNGSVDRLEQTSLNKLLSIYKRRKDVVHGELSAYLFSKRGEQRQDRNRKYSVNYRWI